MRNWTWLWLFALVLGPALSMAQQPKRSGPTKQGRLVFVATTGMEDMGTLQNSFRHAKVAKESGHLQDVVWLSYGRAVVALDPTVKAVPEPVRAAARAAKEAGVELVTCLHAMQMWGIDAEKLEPDARVVTQGVAELARLVAEGYQVIRY